MWQRGDRPNPILTVAGVCLQNPVLAYGFGKVAWNAGSAAVTGARCAATSAAVLAAEASPAAIGGAVAGVAALAGGAALYAASRRQECQTQRLLAVIRNRGRRRLCPAGASYHDAASQLFDSIHWFLSPQKAGMPHVYHGSPWRSAARERQLTQVRQLCAELPPTSAVRLTDRLWGHLTFCFALWLDYNPHTANWGTSPSYGSPPFGQCWHNRWREDLRHVISDLARHFLSEQSFQPDIHGVSYTERESAFCLLVTLDHVLSWEVTTPGFGDSDVVQASMYRYQDFCEKLLQQFALAWALARAPHGEVDLSEYGASMDVSSHMQVMAAREIPDEFRGVWAW